MARTVDPARHEARRLVIIDAALTVFAQHGYDGATTAAICRQAGIGSGTFFHYFPTKRDVLLAILTLGVGDVRDRAERYAGRTDALGVLLDIVRSGAEDAADPRMPGFVRAVGGIMQQPDVAEKLDEDTRAQRDLMLPWVERAQRAGEIRTDLDPGRITSWLYLLTDGFLGRAASEEAFSVVAETETLVDTARRFLAP
ncbi:TetR/AcrR family transcriptional regulator [Promicromonospora thailandica]|uniref:Transcriptional regulator, TetR family n=1 Tax=Promicromonospora thailandica TaxID=765201 RepID=A0A9X2JV18_9MICO|nr:TetR/AcrR family transcriptional regulator [Promicromonospora thailandica]MCP2263643.1 transcriptional regulator, TetR family [Promicromonospora thailandica]